MVASSGHVVAERVYWARTPLERARGLIGRTLEQGECLIIDRARQVHTFGMRRPIDVVFCDRTWAVCHVVSSMAPRRLTRWVWSARYALELPAYTVGEEVVPGAVLVVADHAP